MLNIKKKFAGIYTKAQFRFDGLYRIVAIFLNPFYFSRKSLFKNIVSLAPELHGRILDFGCGSKPYKTIFGNCYEYIGCDVKASGHSHKNENVDVYYDGKQLPFQEESFDSVFSSQVFEHVFNLEEIIAELRRILKCGGVMLVTLPFVWNEHEQPYDFGRYTSFGICDLLERHGFEIIELRKSNSYCEAVMQMWIEYLRGMFENITANRYFTLIFQLIVLAPMTILGIVLSVILPKNDTFYNDLIVLCRKIK